MRYLIIILLFISVPISAQWSTLKNIKTNNIDTKDSARIHLLKGLVFPDGSTQDVAGGGSIETDPVVKAVNGVVKSNGSVISAATSSDYVSPNDTIGGSGTKKIGTAYQESLKQNKADTANNTTSGVMSTFDHKMITYDTAIDSIGTTNQNQSVNFTTFSYEKIRLTGNITITLANLLSTRMRTVYVCVIQDGVGSRLVTWAGIVKFPGGVTPVLSSSANAKDQLMFVWDGSNFVYTSVSYNIL